MENFLDILDGQRVYEDIAFSDSYGRIFSAIPDGSYLFIKNGKEELRGEAYQPLFNLVELATCYFLFSSPISLDRFAEI